MSNDSSGPGALGPAATTLVFCFTRLLVIHGVAGSVGEIQVSKDSDPALLRRPPKD